MNRIITSESACSNSANAGQVGVVARCGGNASFVTIATKKEDGGSRLASTAKTYDAFSYYSNDDVRMRCLLGLGGHEEGQIEDLTQRKTRISFELHFAAVIETALGEL